MPGTVYLVGAGPGDPGLMTRRALELIAAADAILYDRLVPPGALDGARADADLRYVGKAPGAGAMAQEEINRLLVELARGDLAVVRLKGGDPFVFGRGGEEAQALTAAGVPFEVVPGVTAGIAAPAYAGIPVTHREDASAVAFVTGHEDPAKDVSALDWSALAAFPGTLVVFMGTRTLSETASRLIGEGRSASEPAAIVQRGTTAQQRTLSGTLGDIAGRAEEAGIQPPALVVVGPVTALGESLSWFERRPLFGKRVVVTRARAQASRLSGRLATLGAEVIETPSIRIEPRRDDAVQALAEGIEGYRLVCLTSPNGAALLLEALARAGRDARSLAGAVVAAIGPGTATELAARGIRPDVVPRRSTAEGLVEALRPVPLTGPVLVATAAAARDVLPAALRERGAEVEVVALYDTVPEPLTEGQVASVGRADYVAFTSASTVRHFLAALGPRGGPPPGARIASIGPLTSRAAADHGLRVDVEATPHDLDGLVAAIVADAEGRLEGGLPTAVKGPR